MGGGRDQDAIEAGNACPISMSFQQIHVHLLLTGNPVSELPQVGYLYVTFYIEDCRGRAVKSQPKLHFSTLQSRRFYKNMGPSQT